MKTQRNKIIALFTCVFAFTAVTCDVDDTEWAEENSQRLGQVLVEDPQIQRNSTSASAIEARKEILREAIIDSGKSGNYEMNILAAEGLPVPEGTLDETIEKALTMETGDFRLAQLVRLLYLTDEYDDVILPEIQDLDYWLTKGEDQYVYWSENHMILWMSSAYLMRQREGWPMKSNLDQRLNHWLDLKAEYGYYEFFSSTYYQYTLGPLLNLADFAEDATIRNKAITAIKRMARELLLVFNDSGAFYPAAGRNYISRYTKFSPRSLFWILTGRGPMPTNLDYDAGYLATSSINLAAEAATYRSSVNATLRQGHEQKDKTRVHAGFSREERTIFQWSSGGYFHPDTASDTAYTVEKLDLTDRKEFKDLAAVAFLPDSWMNSFSKIGAVFSRGSNLSKATIDIYKNESVGLMSLDNFYPGYKGYQQYPWAATVGDIAVWTQSGNVGGWGKQSGSSLSQNSHFPKVQQTGNVALITYFPKFEIRQGKSDKGVNLHWPTDRFDEHGEIYGHKGGNWLVARKGTSYIAVLRAGKGKLADGTPRNWGDKGRQMWAVVVGNNKTHGSYANFKNVVDRASIKESYKFKWKKMRKIYYTRIEVDGKRISNSW